jgi:hypothetical protein
MSGTVALLGAEIALRSFGYYGVREAKVGVVIPAPHDKILDFRGQPNAEWVQNGVPARTNDHGWRDYDYSYAKRPGTFRIIALGDSVLNGHGVRTQEVFAKHLERRLNGGKQRGNFEVVMLAIGALNTVQEAHLLQVEGLKYEPDFILLTYILNDADYGHSLRRAKEHKVSTWQRFRQLLKHSSVIYYSYRGLEELGWKLGIQLVGGAELGKRQIASDYYTKIHNDQERWDKVASSLAKISALSQKQKIPYCLVIFPVFYQLERYPWAAVHQKVTTAAQSLDFEVLDLLETYKTVDEKSVRLGWGDFIHPNAVGQAMAGDAIYDFLIEKGLVPNALLVAD